MKNCRRYSSLTFYNVSNRNHVTVESGAKDSNPSMSRVCLDFLPVTTLYTCH